MKDVEIHRISISWLIHICIKLCDFEEFASRPVETKSLHARRAILTAFSSIPPICGIPDLHDNSRSMPVTILTCFLEVLSSNPGWDTGCPDWGFPWFSLPTLDKYFYNSSIKPRVLPSKYFPIHDSSNILPFDGAGYGCYEHHNITHK
jgi:hypothetical protein